MLETVHHQNGPPVKFGHCSFSDDARLSLQLILPYLPIQPQEQQRYPTRENDRMLVTGKAAVDGTAQVNLLVRGIQSSCPSRKIRTHTDVSRRTHEISSTHFRAGDSVVFHSLDRIENKPQPTTSSNQAYLYLCNCYKKELRNRRENGRNSDPTITINDSRWRKKRCSVFSVPTQFITNNHKNVCRDKGR